MKTSSNRKNLALGFTQSYFFALTISTMLFGNWLGNYFIGDDWPTLLRNKDIVWNQIPGWFVSMRAGWYRPLYDIFVAICWQLFGVHWAGYRFITLMLYAIVAMQVGQLAIQLTMKPRVKWLAIVLFCVCAVHAEPVLLFAATNELLAAMFLLLSVSTYIHFRNTDQQTWYWTSLTSGLLAFTTKETSVVLPFLILLYDILYFRSERNASWKGFLLPSVPYLIMLGVYLALRIPQGSSYLSMIEPTPVRIALNFLYYLLVAVLALPNNYAFLSTLPLWQTSPWLPIFMLSVSTTSLLLLMGIVYRQQFWKRSWQELRAVTFAIVWSLIALAPVLLIVSTRAAFMSTIGIVLTISIVVVALWNNSANQWNHRFQLSVIIVLYVTVQTVGLLYQNRLWGKSSAISESVLRQVKMIVETRPDIPSILLLDLPDHTEYATTFRNTFPSAGYVAGFPMAIQGVLDSDTKSLSDAERTQLIRSKQKDEYSALFQYKDGELVAVEQ